jgi:hypothetical protein
MCEVRSDDELKGWPTVTVRAAVGRPVYANVRRVQLQGCSPAPRESPHVCVPQCIHYILLCLCRSEVRDFLVCASSHGMWE